MSVIEHTDHFLTGEVLEHLDAQLKSVRSLLAIVLEQGVAIRNRDVQNVVTLTGVLHAELHRRQLIEEERVRLLERAGARLGVTAGSVTLSLLEELMDPVTAQTARARSAELRGLLEVVQREHHVNRALMNQELAFLDHLLRLAGSPDVGYDAAGDRPAVSRVAPSAHRVFDMEA
jgi:FlgN protein